MDVRSDYGGGRSNLIQAFIKTEELRILQSNVLFGKTADGNGEPYPQILFYSGLSKLTMSRYVLYFAKKGVTDKFVFMYWAPTKDANIVKIQEIAVWPRNDNELLPYSYKITHTNASRIVITLGEPADVAYVRHLVQLDVFCSHRDVSNLSYLNIGNSNYLTPSGVTGFPLYMKS